MVEVFSTNICDEHSARLILEDIHHYYKGCSANFDLEDCDNILRIEYHDTSFCPKKIISLLEVRGHRGNVLED